MNRIRNRRRVSIRTTTTALAVVAVAACAGGAAARDCAPSPVRADIGGEALTQAERIARLDEALNESLARFDECQDDVPVTEEPVAGTENASGGPADASGDAADGGGDGTGRTAAAEGDGESGNARPGEPADDGDGVDSVAATGVEGSQDSGDGAPATPGGSAVSVAATGIEGTQDSGDDAPATPGGAESVAAEGVEGTQPPEDDAGTTSGTSRPAGSGGAPGDHAGVIPDDIPEPGNDSVLEAQIRRAAMEETDPRTRAELWNEYRKYKGLPPKPLPEDDGDPSDAETSQ